MAISSINSNLAAILAQSNISNATSAASNDVSALSSGNRIVSAATDVAALAAGTGLQSQVNVLTAALSVASQGSSLLQVADGGLTQIQSILQRQQAIATSAQSGSLSSTQRGFLDQEFQQLSQEIDQLASSTSFNGVNLLDGSISGSNPLQSSNAGSGAAAAAISGFTATGLVTSFTSFNSNGTNNDTTFYGDLSKGTFTVKADATTSTGYDISYSINGSTYHGFAALGDTTIALSNGNATLTLGTSALLTAATASNVTDLQSNLTGALAGATGYAIHKIRTTDATDALTGAVIQGSSIAAATGSSGGTNFTNGTLLKGFTGAAVKVQSAGFTGKNAPSISNFSATTSGGALSGLSLTVNGQVYSTGIAAAGAGNKLSTETFGGGSAGVAVFYLGGNTSSNEKVTIDFSTLSADATDTNSTGGVQSITDALNHTFGSGGSGLSFQVGATSKESIGITLGSASSKTLFAGATLDVKTQGTAVTAANAVTTALNTVTALRATVGASEERFNFATSAIQNAVQNQSAAKSNLLDTDVAATSTHFATSQVQLQAGIAVLAQANQLQQAILKLI